MFGAPKTKDLTPQQVKAALENNGFVRARARLAVIHGAHRHRIELKFKLRP